MRRCRESAGVLFSHPCKQSATTTCSSCRKPICDAHARKTGDAVRCVSCVRQDLTDRHNRGSHAFLRDDPYFYWYYYDDTWYDAPYTADDSSLFDRHRHRHHHHDDVMGGDFDNTWDGS